MKANSALLASPVRGKAERKITMPIPKEVEDWIASSPYSDETKAQLRKEAEKDEIAKFTRESVMMRSDYSRELDKVKKDKEDFIAKEKARIEGKEAELSEAQRLYSETDNKRTKKAQEQADKIVKLTAQIHGVKTKMLEKLEIEPPAGMTVQQFVDDLFGKIDDAPPPARTNDDGGRSSFPDGFDPNQYIKADDYKKNTGQLLAAMGRYHNWFYKKDREHRKLFGGEDLDVDKMWNAIMANPDKPYDEVYDMTFDAATKRRELQEADINSRAEKLAKDKFDKMMEGRSLEDTKRPDLPAFSAFQQPPTTDGSPLPEVDPKADREMHLAALGHWEEAEGAGAS